MSMQNRLGLPAADGPKNVRTSPLRENVNRDTHKGLARLSKLTGMTVAQVIQALVAERLGEES